ncbi:hypothetical protein ABT052_15465 [Streptomyces sp. NPDC002766]|uniref:hypothetical protein n=1 Tax=Streptomyces sp. NPDC002766 TaxID=3154429 RepID=UPI003326C381
MTKHDPAADDRRPGGLPVRCQGPYGRPEDGGDCPDPARLEVVRFRRPAPAVCPVRLGPSPLTAGDVLWPPQISLVR